MDPETGYWTEYPCRKKCCPRHWRRFAVQTYHRVKGKLSSFPFWYHVRLSCRCAIERGKRFRAVSNFVRKLHAGYGPILVITIAHRKRKCDHFHTLIGSTVPINPDDVNAFWAAHFPGKPRPYRKDYTWTKPIDNPRYLLWYALMGRKRKPREQPPWRDIPLRSPVGVYDKRAGSVLRQADAEGRCRAAGRTCRRESGRFNMTARAATAYRVSQERRSRPFPC
jgi:hypothetical protein